MAVSRRRNVRNRKTNSKERSQSRRFVILFLLFVSLFYLMYYITQLQPTKDQPKILSAQDSVLIFAKNVANEQNTTDTLSLSLNPDDQLKTLSQKLGVIDELIKIKEKDGQTNISLALNSNLMDLNFANYFFTKMLLSKQWKLISGEENTAGSMQTLTFLTPNHSKKYQINLFYDKSNSYPIQNPKVAIIITELGLKKMPNLIEFLKSPYPINYAIIPYRKQTDTFVQLLGSANVELLINIPMEDINYPQVDHGKNAITVKLKEHEIKKYIEDYIKIIPNAKGSINYLGSLASTDETIMKYTMNSLKEKNLYFVDNVSSVSSVAFSVAQKMVLSSYRKTISFDFKDKKETLDTKIAKMKEFAGDSQIIIVTIPASDLPKPSEFIKLCNKIKLSNYDIVEISSLEEEIFF